LQAEWINFPGATILFSAGRGFAAIYAGPEESCNTPALCDAGILIDRLS
jgi:hypothetical protein